MTAAHVSSQPSPPPATRVEEADKEREGADSNAWMRAAYQQRHLRRVVLTEPFRLEAEAEIKQEVRISFFFNTGETF